MYIAFLLDNLVGKLELIDYGTSGYNLYLEDNGNAAADLAALLERLGLKTAARIENGQDTAQVELTHAEARKLLLAIADVTVPA